MIRRNAVPCVLLAAGFLAGPALAQHKQPTEAQCREVVNGMLQAMKSSLPQMPERDRKGAQEMIDKAEKIVRDNRARGAKECDSWAAIGNLVTK